MTAENAHPHLDEAHRIAVVHNGIIENYADLKSQLLARGHAFASETDSEVVAHLVEEQLAAGIDLVPAVASVFETLTGYNAIVVLDSLDQRFVATKRVSPLVLGRGRTASTISSDAIALRGHADELIYLEDDQLAVLSPQSIEVLDRAGLTPVRPLTVPMANDGDEVTLGEHPFFMAKEMFEQPATLRRLVRDAEDEIAALAAPSPLGLDDSFGRLRHGGQRRPRRHLSP